MNKVRSFSNDVLGSVRVVLIDGVSWFVANDITNALGYSNGRDAIRVHVSEEYRKALQYKACRDSRQADLMVLWGHNDFSDKTIVSEAGMWQLVFGSKLDKALDFQKWIYSVVLPSLRENGGYIDGQESLEPQELASLKEVIKKLNHAVSEKTRKIESQKEWIEELEYELDEARKEVYRLNARFDQMDRDGICSLY